MMVHVCTRVDELRNLKVRDCSVREPKVNKTEILYVMTATGHYVVEEPQSYFEAHISGKTGIRKTICGHAAVEAFERVVKRNGLTPENKLFPESQRDAFRELLQDERCDLYRNKLGESRNLKCLRCTGLMLRVLKNPRINLKLLANSVGTSVTMLDLFYLKPLNVDMNVDELLA